MSIPALGLLPNAVMVRPLALRRLVPFGLPEGIRIVEKTNWSGIGHVIPRFQLKEHQERAAAAALLDSEA